MKDIEDIKQHDEFMAEKRSNQYFSLEDIIPLDIDYKKGSMLSRPACNGQPYSDELMEICTHLGNACNYKKTIQLIENGYDFAILCTENSNE
jgi:hypothetical protein